MQKFGIGQPATRFEDGRLLSGKGRYVEDIELENQSFATFVRSPHAHAEIKSVDTKEAVRMISIFLHGLSANMAAGMSANKARALLHGQLDLVLTARKKAHQS